MTTDPQTNAPAALHRYVGDVSNLPVYGRVCMFTVHEGAFDHDVVSAQLDAVGLSEYAPKRPADVDVFRRVSTTAGSSRFPHEDGTYSNVMIRDVTSDGTDDTVLRRVVVEHVDADDEILSYTEAYDLRFHKDDGRLIYVPLTGDPSVADDVVPGILTDYLAKRGTINGDGIRTLMRRALRDHHAVSIRKSGGVFFVPDAQNQMLEGLHAFARNYGQIALYSFPLVKETDGTGGDLLAAAVTDEVLDEVADLVTKIQRPELTERGLATIVERQAEIRRRTEVYREMLQDQLSIASTHLESLDSAINGAVMAMGTDTAAAA